MDEVSLLRVRLNGKSHQTKENKASTDSSGGIRTKPGQWHNNYRSGRNAGYSDRNLAQSGHQVLKAIRLRMPELMDEIGLSKRALIEKYLTPLLNAKDTKFFQHNGKVTDQRKVPALSVRADALDMAFRLRGSYTPSRLEEPPIGVQVVLVPGAPRPIPPALGPAQSAEAPKAVIDSVTGGKTNA